MASGHRSSRDQLKGLFNLVVLLWEGIPGITLFISSISALLAPLFADKRVEIWSWSFSGEQVAIAIAIVTLLVGSVLAFLRRRSLDSLESELESIKSRESAYRLDSLEAFSIALRKLMLACDLSRPGGAPSDKWSHLRATLYCHHPDEQRLIPLARRSDNPTLEGFGRKSYPDDQGVIGEAWEKGYKVQTSLPENKEEWIQRHLDFKFEEDEARKLTMHCRSIVAIRIDLGHRRLGMIVIESLKPLGANGSVQDTVANCEWMGGIALLLVAINGNLLFEIEAGVKSKKDLTPDKDK